jgi:hypothetical protein
LAASAAASPTNSVPAKANAALTKTLHIPLKPLWKAPGLCQSSPPLRKGQHLAIQHMKNPDKIFASGCSRIGQAEISDMESNE